MTQTYFPFDSGNGASVTEAQWYQMARKWRSTGVLAGELDELEVYGDSSGMQVKVKSGQAWVEGHFFQSDSEETLAVAAADASNPRVDRVVVRLNRVDNIVQLVVLTGTAVASPSAPSLTQSSSVWETSLAQVSVSAGATSIASGDVADERSFAFAADTPYLAKTRTIKLNNGMSGSEMQAIFDEVAHYIPAGHELVFQFDDGVYTPYQTLALRGFHGGGRLTLQGNPLESGLHTTQAVVINGLTHAHDCISFSDCVLSTIKVKNICVRHDTGAAHYHGVIAYNGGGGVIDCDGCYAEGDGTGYGVGFYALYGARIYAHNSYVASQKAGLGCTYGGLIVSQNNDDAATQPAYGLWIVAGGNIQKINVQPSGSTANELITLAGEIW